MQLNINAVVAQAPVTGSGTQNLSTDARIERLERVLQSQGLLDMLRQLQQLQQEISQLRGEIETQNYNLEQLTRRQRDLYTDVDQRMQRLERGAIPTEEVISYIADGEGPDEPPLETLSAIPDYSEASSVRSDSPLLVEIIETPVTSTEIYNQLPAATDPTTLATVAKTADLEISPVIATQEVSVDPVQLQAEYQQAFNLLRQSLYDQAIRAFQQFLALHPNDMYSDNAQYWLAEAYYVKREFQQALFEYNNVVTKFPQSQKVTDALLKIGFTLYELGEIEAAKQQLQELIEKQPGSTVARLADERLKIINSVTSNNPSVVN